MPREAWPSLLPFRPEGRMRGSGLALYPWSTWFVQAPQYRDRWINGRVFISSSDRRPNGLSRMQVLGTMAWKDCLINGVAYSYCLGGQILGIWRWKDVVAAFKGHTIWLYWGSHLAYLYQERKQALLLFSLWYRLPWGASRTIQKVGEGNLGVRWFLGKV